MTSATVADMLELHELPQGAQRAVLALIAEAWADGFECCAARFGSPAAIGTGEGARFYCEWVRDRVMSNAAA